MNQRAPLPHLANLAFIEELHLAFLRDPKSVSPAWRDYFEKLGHDSGSRPTLQRGPSFSPKALFDSSRDHSGHTEAVTSPPARDTITGQQ
ncbi:MAG: 2-oxoglutarate dehydrogenase E1 subunit family protein, partial [Nitrospiraceae bacterium]